MNLQTLVNRPETVLYAFAPDAFIAKLGNKAKTIVYYKKQNQVKLINTLAVDAGMDYASATARIQQSFQNAYGMYPYDALKVLASGGEVAGKNWAKGVFGIGLLPKRQDFAQNMGVSVDPKTGKILVNGVEGANQVSVYSGSKIKSYSYTDANGNTYTSVRNLSGKYYANTYTASGSEVTQNANGDTVTSADSASIWTSVTEIFNNLWNWLMRLLGINKEETILDPQNTIPMQTDGFVEEETSVGEAAMWAVLAVGAGVMLSGGLKPKRGKKNK